MSLRAIVRDYGNQISIFAFGAKSCEKETLGRNLIFQSNRTTTDYSDSASILHNVNFLEFLLLITLLKKVQCTLLKLYLKD